MAERKDWRGEIQVDFDEFIEAAENREEAMKQSIKFLEDGTRMLMDDMGRPDFNPYDFIKLVNEANELAKMLVNLELDTIRLKAAKEEQVSRWRNESFQWGAIAVAALSLLVSAINLFVKS